MKKELEKAKEKQKDLCLKCGDIDHKDGVMICYGSGERIDWMIDAMLSPDLCRGFYEKISGTK